MDYFDDKIKEATAKMLEAQRNGDFKLAEKYKKIIDDFEAEKAYFILELFKDDFGFGRK